MKRSFLRELGLKKEIIDKIMRENGRDIETAKSRADMYKDQVNTEFSPGTQKTIRKYTEITYSEMCDYMEEK